MLGPIAFGFALGYFAHILQVRLRTWLIPR